MRKIIEIHNLIIEKMGKIGIPLMRVSIGIIFFWFGALKFFDGLSPAQTLAIETIDLMTFGIFTEKVIIYGLATWEVLIGIGMLFNLYIKQTIILLFLQMAGTFMPVFLFPGEVFNIFPYSLTLEGQYIIKNLVVISGAIIIGGKLPKKMVKTEQ
ncbi:hypothetical protein SDC9_61165 [bioreactor metagenome]|uniref:Inner membrane protein YkgB n=1 Tax=bioreactor metagenome TaxID=1076179 RepID=A0A644XGB4_9ZZZZ|nr:DUF417 family protein [Rikenellaceae bacterium]